MVESLGLREVGLATVGAFPHEQRAVLDLFLKFGVLTDIDAVPDFNSVFFSATGTSCRDLLWHIHLTKNSLIILRTAGKIGGKDIPAPYLSSHFQTLYISAPQARNRTT